MKKKSKLSLYTPMNMLGLALMLLMNTLAVTLPLGGYETGELSDLYPNLFVPAGITFAIWGLLYVCLTGFVAYSYILDRNNTNRHEHPLKASSPLFFLSCLLNGAWIAAWHYLLVAQSLIIMAALLLTLIVLYERVAGRRYATLIEAFFIKGTVSLYLGWISVATIANAAAYWVSLKPQSYGLSETAWTLVFVFAAALIGAVMSLWRRDLLYSAVILWALYGIYLKHVTVFDFKYPAIVLGTQLGMGLVTAAMAFGGYRLYKRQ